MSVSRSVPGTFTPPRARLLASTALLAALTVVPVPALAQVVWDGSSDRDWTDGTNWDSGAAPVGNNVAEISDGALANQPVIGNGDAVSVRRVDLTGGSLDVRGSLTTTQGVNVGAGGTLTVFSGTAPNGTVTGGVNSAGTVDNRGSIDTATITGGTFTNRGTITGATTVSGGALTLTNGSDLSDTAALTVNGTGTVNVQTAETVGTLAGNSATATVNLNADLSVGGADGSSSYAGALNGAGDLVKNGTGVLTLTGNGAGHTGTIVVNDGEVAFTGAAVSSADIDIAATGEVSSDGGTFGAGTTITNAGVLDLNGSETVGTLTGAGAVELAGGTTLTLQGGTSTIGGVVSGNGGLTVNGGSTTITAAATYSGATTVQAGTLNLTGVGALNSGVVSIGAAGQLVTDGDGLDGAAAVDNAGALVLNGDESIASLNGAGTVALDGGNLSLTAGASVVGGVISGSGGLTVSGTSVTTLNAANTYAGGTTVAGGGTLNVGATGSIGGLTVNGGGTANNSGTTGDVDLNGTGIFNNLAGGTAGNVDVAAASTFNNQAGAQAGDVTTLGNTTNEGTLGSLTVNGGTTTINGAGTISGGTTVTAGTLNLNGANSLSDAGTLTVNAGSVNVNVAETVGALTGTGGRVNVTGTLTAGGSGATTTYSGQVNGAGGLTKAGSGTLTLTGANGFGGTLTVEAGTLAVTGAGSLATTSITTTGGTLSTDGGALAAGMAITNGGNLSFTGSESIGSITGAGAVALGNAATNLTLTAGNSTIDGVISGTGRLTVAGGNVTLTQANTYGGPTTVVSGALALTGAGAIASNVVNVNGGALSTDGGGLAATATLGVNGGAFTATGAETVAAVNLTAGSLNGAGPLSTGTFTQTGGTVAAGANVASTGAQSLQGGTIEGTLSGAGAVTVTNGTTTVQGAGRIDSGSVTVASGTLSVDGDALADTAAVAVNGGTLSAAGTDTIGTLAQSAGVISGTGTITTGSYVQTGGTTAGTVTVATGTFNQSGASANIGAGSTVTASGLKTLAGGTQADNATIVGTLNGAGAVDVTGGFTTVEGPGVIEGASAIDVRAGATLSSLGALRTTGTLTNAGTLNLAGSVDGVLVNNGTLAVTGNLAGGADAVTNNGTMTIAGGNVSGFGTLNNTATGVLRFTGEPALRSIGGDVNNNTGGVIELRGRTEITGQLRSDAQAVTSMWDGNCGGAACAPGADELTYDRDGDADDVLTAGAVSGGTFRLDVDLLAGAADRIHLTGTGVDATRRTTFVTAVNLGLIPLGNRATIMTGEAGAARDSIQTAFDAGQFVIRSPGSAVVQVLQMNGTGGLDVVATTSSGIGGLASSVSGIQTLISSVVNRPSSPFTGGLAAEEGCFRGGFARATAGKATIEAGSTNLTSIVSESNTTVSANYSGIQAGYDLGCNDGRFLKGWDGSAGVLLGFNRGTSSQNVLQPNGLDAPIVTSEIGSDFDQTYLGAYVAGSRNNLTADVTLRFDTTDFELSETEVVNNAALGVDGETFSSNSTSLIGRLSYNIEISDELAFVPTGGVSLTRTKGNTVNIGDGAGGGVLTLDDYSSNVVFLGGTLARTTINPDGTSASTLFVSGNYYNDVADNRKARFTPNAVGGITEQIELENLGAFGELSLGWNYVKILENGPAGARQLNTSVRVDTRFGSNVSDSYSLTAQVRLTF